MRGVKMDQARKALEEAHQLDPFNLRTTNYLKLLDKMGSYAKKETAHFVVIYDPQADPVIPEYFSDYLESVQAQVCAAYNFTPEVKTYIEVFPTHEAFSVRTTGSTWLPTVGASTSRVIQLVAGLPPAVHFGLVYIDTILASKAFLGAAYFGVPKLPTPYDTFEWAVVSSFFLVHALARRASNVTQWLNKKG